MTSKIYLAIILTDYQELNFKRFIDHFHIKDKIIAIKYSNNKIFRKSCNRYTTCNIKTFNFLCKFEVKLFLFDLNLYNLKRKIEYSR